ncbi:MAG: Na(+)-translocating NADH-quinone reductase subunit C [Thermoguttaceae bacterium]|nr:Na(+)-translocating NADH-quinone reductase subunit C [Thermoguttaceae bacterium]
MANESISKTFGVATGLCVVCAIIVAVASVSLKGVQERNKALDKNVNILRAAGLVKPGEKVSSAKVDELFADTKRVVVDLASGKIDETADPDAVEADKNNVVTLAKEDDVASIKTIPQKTVVYLFNDKNGALKTAVLPIVGSGLWSIMRGYLALNSDLTSVAHIVFYDHGETPGLGGEISNPLWTAKWEGKKALDDEGKPIIKVVKGTAAPESSDVDGISGATLTGNGVTNTVTFWLGDKGFGPFLKEFKAETLQNDEPGKERR